MVMYACSSLFLTVRKTAYEFPLDLGAALVLI